MSDVVDSFNENYTPWDGWTREPTYCRKDQIVTSVAFWKAVFVAEGGAAQGGSDLLHRCGRTANFIAWSSGSDGWEIAEGSRRSPLLVASSLRRSSSRASGGAPSLLGLAVDVPLSNSRSALPQKHFRRTTRAGNGGARRNASISLERRACSPAATFKQLRQPLLLGGRLHEALSQLLRLTASCCRSLVEVASASANCSFSSRAASFSRRASSPSCARRSSGS